MKVVLAFASTACVGASDETGLLQQKVISAQDTTPTGNTPDGSQCPCGSCSNGCAPSEKTTTCEDFNTDITTAFSDGHTFDSAGGKSSLEGCPKASCTGMHWISSCASCVSNTAFLDFPTASTNADRVVGPPACLGGAGSVCTCTAAALVVATPATGLFLSCAKVPRGVHSTANQQGWVDWCNGAFCSTLQNIDTFGCHDRCKCDPTAATTAPTSGQTSTYPLVNAYCDGMGNGCYGPDGLACQKDNVEYSEMWDYRYLSRDQCTKGIAKGVIPANLPLTLCGSSVPAAGYLVAKDVTKKCGSASDSPICSWYNPGSCQPSCVADALKPPGATHTCAGMFHAGWSAHCTSGVSQPVYSKCCICTAGP